MNDQCEQPDVPLVVTVPVLRLDPGGHLPNYAHCGDAGADLRAAEDAEIFAGQRRRVRTGIAIEIPDGHVGLILPRSGLAHEKGLTVLNAPGVIDPGYRGEIYINLINHDPVRIVRLRKGDRIAQLLIQPISQIHFQAADMLPDTERGQSGHGSSGR